LQCYLPDNSAEIGADRRRPAVIVCPGGAYLFTSDREGEQVALRFAAQGYHAFVLRYSTSFGRQRHVDFTVDLPEDGASVYPKPLFDLAKAMLTIRGNAEQWLVDTDKIAVCGFSAGGHLAASLGVHWDGQHLRDKFGVDGAMFKPNALVLGYAATDFTLKKMMEQPANPDHIRLKAFAQLAMFGAAEPALEQLQAASPAQFVSSGTPPAFIWHTADDQVVDVTNALAFASAMAAQQVPFELHVFESGLHGLSLCDESTAGDARFINPDCGVWVDLAMKWLRRRFATAKEM